METTETQEGRLAHKWRYLGWLAAAELLAMTLWFSASAVIPQLTAEWALDGAQQSWMTMSVQIGFVAGALLSAAANLADRVSSRLLMGISALLGAALNLMAPLFNPAPATAFLLRFCTGVTMAGIYPLGMKLAATWCRKDRGAGIGFLVGALTVGSAFPHLLNALPFSGADGMPPWRAVLISTSGMAGLAAVIAFFFIKEGPYLARTAPFDWRFIGKALAHRPTRLANFGYLGHMWELYAMWAWAPICLLASYEAASWNHQAARLAGFGVVGVGAVGCIGAGMLADRWGRTAITSWSLVLSGLCALSAGFFFSSPGLLTVVCLIWGIAVVADSAQYSAAVSELTDPRYVGTALTAQTSLGFLLTLFTIRMVPPLVDAVGWEHVFMTLAIGPVFGIRSMLRLRRLPEAVRMASGNR